MRENRRSQVQVMPHTRHKVQVRRLRIHRTMRILHIDADRPEKGLVSQIASLVRRGKVFIYPTDTVYGLGCRIDDPKAVERIYAIKGREEGKPLSIAVSGMGMAKEYAVIDPSAERMLKASGEPLTLILKKKGSVPDYVTGGLDTVGLRIVDCSFVKMLIDELGTPIITTSANTSGNKPPACVADIEHRVLEDVDVLIDARTCGTGKPSKVIDHSTGSILR